MTVTSPCDFFLRTDSSHLTPVIFSLPAPPCSFKAWQQYRTIRVGGIVLVGIRLHIDTALPLLSRGLSNITSG